LKADERYAVVCLAIWRRDEQAPARAGTPFVIVSEDDLEELARILAASRGVDSTGLV
jgi:hypothetical protein